VVNEELREQDGVVPALRPALAFGIQQVRDTARANELVELSGVFEVSVADVVLRTANVAQNRSVQAQ
jgi:hypothetical protein